MSSPTPYETSSFDANPIAVGYASEEIGGDKMSGQCKDTVRRGNETMEFTHTSYSGIPENILLNIAVWILVMLIFIFIRRFWIYREERFKKKKSCAEQIEAALGWIGTVFKLQDKTITQKCGSDALIYLIFQRYIIIYMFGVTVLSLVIVLPINYHGHLASNFGKTTIANVDGKSQNLWVHALLSSVYLLAAILLMKLFKNRYIIGSRRHQTSRTLMVCNIPTQYIDTKRLQQYFADTMPGVTMESMNFAYDVKHLIKLNDNRQYIRSIRQQAERKYESRGIDEQIAMCPSHICLCEPCICMCRLKKVDAVEYYMNEEVEMRVKYDQHMEKVLEGPLSIAFLTFTHEGMAIRVHNSFNKLFSCQCYFPHCFVYGLNENRWMVRFAPPPEDIYWENLAGNQVWWWIKATLLNVGIFVLVFIFTTPSVIINLLNDFNYKKQVEVINNPYLVNIIPVLLLVLFSALLPVLVTIMEVCVGHWTRSVEQKFVMMKVFVLLLLMVLILPSVGLTSAQALLSWLSNTETTGATSDFRWECIFLPDNGAFFVNYVISASLIGTVMLLLRVPALLIFLLRMLCASSAAERVIIRQGDAPPVPYGTMYAWICTIFCMCISYSIICPLIAPFGLFYFCMRHLADRHHLYYVFKPTSLGPEPHTNAISFIHVGVLLLQIFMAVFMGIRAQSVPGASIFCLLTLLVAICYLGSRSINQYVNTIRRKMQRNQGFEPDITQAMQLERNAQKQMMNQLKQYPYLPEELREDAGPDRIVKNVPSGVVVT